METKMQRILLSAILITLCLNVSAEDSRNWQAWNMDTAQPADTSRSKNAEGSYTVTAGGRESYGERDEGTFAGIKVSHPVYTHSTHS